MRIDRARSDSQILEALGTRLRAARRAASLTLADLAARTGLNVTTLHKAEHGGNFTMLTLVKVLRALGQVEQLDLLLPTAPVSPLALLEERRRGG